MKFRDCAAAVMVRQTTTFTFYLPSQNANLSSVFKTYLLSTTCVAQGRSYCFAVCFCFMSWIIL
ncbi:Precorrin-3B synthase [Umezakia ovalisporum]|nr:Precorrin-3B synthase [Umezakia ovalisporum]